MIQDPNALVGHVSNAKAKSHKQDVHKTPRSSKSKAADEETPQRAIKEASVESSLSELSDIAELPETENKVPKSSARNEGVDQHDPEAESEEAAADPEELKEALSRPPPVNSSYLPLPWKGRLGYACLNTYLRNANPPIFSSRTCRIASILEHRHPLKDPSQPEHPTKNRPDKDQPADVKRGQAYVEALGLANARDIPKMLRWNNKYGIKFLRLSSEMFPFASHEVYGYKLAPFASEALAEAGRVAAELGHRLTTHPGQFTQLGSPRKEVISASIRDLEYHCEMLDLLNLPPQQDRDAVMILHMGGVFGDKAATIQRFKENYMKLPQKIKDRLVLENDDVCYSVHDLLPVCEELNIPLVLDYHHHNIYFDADQIREGTLDIMALYDRIRATWTRKGITQKMHYSEPVPSAITARQRRKHNPRVATLPPCPPDMDLMIEAKDKEQACFELMRTFKLPGWDTFADILPHTRPDENRPWKPPKKKTPKKKSAPADVEPVPQPPPLVPEGDISMGGPEGRVYWPPGMEEWLRPKKREVKARDPTKALSLAEKAARKAAQKAVSQPEMTRKKLEEPIKTKSARAAQSVTPKQKKAPRVVPTPSTSDFDDRQEDEWNVSDLTDRDEGPSLKMELKKFKQLPVRRQSGRAVKKAQVQHTEVDEDMDIE